MQRTPRALEMYSTVYSIITNSTIRVFRTGLVYSTVLYSTCNRQVTLYNNRATYRHFLDLLNNDYCYEVFELYCTVYCEIGTLLYCAESGLRAYCHARMLVDGYGARIQYCILLYSINVPQ